MSKFNIGDKVRCIDSGFTDELVVGNIYTVERHTTVYNRPAIIVTGVNRGFYPHRFELVKQKTRKVI